MLRESPDQGTHTPALCPMRLRHGEQVSLRVQRGSRRCGTPDRGGSVATNSRLLSFRERQRERPSFTVPHLHVFVNTYDSPSGKTLPLPPFAWLPRVAIHV
jgi:hypothetical protein